MARPSHKWRVEPEARLSPLARWQGRKTIFYDIIAAMGPSFALGVFAAIIGTFTLVVVMDMYLNFHKHNGTLTATTTRRGAFLGRALSLLDLRYWLPWRPR